MEIVDFTTGAVVIDIAKMSLWSGTKVLTSKEYSEMLYTSDGENILHMPIRRRNWPSDMQKKYSEIADAAQEDVAIVPRGTGYKRKGRRGQPRYEMDDMMMEDMMMEEMMMMEMGGRRRR